MHIIIFLSLNIRRKIQNILKMNHSLKKLEKKFIIYYLKEAK